jgi:hypothetical protein
MGTQPREDIPHGPTSSLSTANLAQRSISRRELLKGSIGVAVLIAVPQVLSNTVSAAALTQLTGSANQGFFYLYGIPDAVTAPTLQAAHLPALESLNTVGTRLAALPVSSPDQSKLGLVAIEGADAAPAVRVTVVDKGSGQLVSTGTLAMASPAGAMLLAKPVFAADSTTLCIVLSITVPTNRGNRTKFDPTTGGTITVPTATWVSHHALAYFNWQTRQFKGPFDLADAPSLALVNAVATDKDLFVWSLSEPAALLAAGKPLAQPQLAAYPLGSGKPRFVAPASDVWPVNDEPVVALGGGRLARLVHGQAIESYSTADGSWTSMALSSLAEGSAKPAPASMHLRNDGLALIAKPVVGQAVLVDMSRSFEVVSKVSFPAPASARGGPSGKVVLSTDGKTLYVLGSAPSGGVAAYDRSTGARVAAHLDGIQYTGLYGLATGVLLATNATSPRLSFFDPGLNPIGTADTNLHVVEVL